MSLRGLGLLLAALAVLLVLVLWVDRPARKPEESADLGTLLGSEAPRVEAVEIETGSSVARLERRGENAWRLVRPFDAEADPRRVEELLRSLAGARVIKVVESGSSRLSRFGLDPPGHRVRIYTRSAREPRTILLGRPSPVGAERYASLSDGRVLLVGAEVETALDRKPEDFRENRLFPVDPERIRAIRIERPRGRLALAREGSQWRMTEPVRDLADAGQADALARHLAGVSLSRTPGTPEEPPTVAALGHPAITVVVETDPGGPPIEARIAAAEKDGRHFAVRSGTPESGFISAPEEKELERDAEDFRDRRVIPISSEAVLGIGIRKSGSTLRLSRAPDGESWTVAREGAASAPADSAKVEEFLDRICMLRADSILPDLGRMEGKSLGEIELSGKTGRLGLIELVAIPAGDEKRQGAGAEASRTERARTTWRPGWLFEISDEALGTIPLGPADLARGGGKTAP